MKKIKRHILSFDDEIEENIEWIGICTSHSDYRLVWGLNQALSSFLAKQDENFHVVRKGAVNAEFPFYFWLQEETLASFYLIKNKSVNVHLIPEKLQIDYFLVIKNTEHVDIELILEQVKSVNSVMAAFSFDERSLPSAEGLVFD